MSARVEAEGGLEQKDFHRPIPQDDWTLSATQPPGSQLMAWTCNLCPSSWNRSPNIRITRALEMMGEHNFKVHITGEKGRLWRWYK